MVNDHDLYDDYEGATLREAIIANGKKRAKKGKGCEHVGFVADIDGTVIIETCEDACIWAGGTMLIE